MAYDPGAIDAILAAAVGDEPGLIAELREAFLDSAKRCFAAMEDAPDDDAWRGAALRMKGLAASFGAIRLMAMASQAAEKPFGDPDTLRRMKQAVVRL
ncbi:Hpt domain-containing protein [Stakelama sp. CBK3Z-3]|uniref:Hpt domain-containing protein n=1 Tax=Stakelama flava TaxID=2860338 RepID=A0ABS6XHG7_9SPHN|nr:Hpt domain-containing protein [Stakelama flava]MBW4329344.1 Hpt domain-containing protein [Stakelama flava]